MPIPLNPLPSWIHWRTSIRVPDSRFLTETAEKIRGSYRGQVYQDIIVYGVYMCIHIYIVWNQWLDMYNTSKLFLTCSRAWGQALCLSVLPFSES